MLSAQVPATNNHSGKILPNQKMTFPSIPMKQDIHGKIHCKNLPIEKYYLIARIYYSYGRMHMSHIAKVCKIELEK